MKITDKQKKLIIGGGIAGLTLLALSSGSDTDGGFGGGGGGMTQGSVPLLEGSTKKSGVSSDPTEPAINIFYPETQPFDFTPSWFVDDPVSTSPLPKKTSTEPIQLTGSWTVPEVYTKGPTASAWKIEPDTTSSKKVKLAEAPVAGRAGLVPSTITMTQPERPVETKKTVTVPKTGNIYTDTASSVIGGMQNLWSKFALIF
ncbi:MAG: hypothetical protein SVM80_12030 [Halobacteriota archaeon]|nr:hypothetical protein [Halobacteriota archaeon]